MAEVVLFRVSTAAGDVQIVADVDDITHRTLTLRGFNQTGGAASVRVSQMDGARPTNMTVAANTLVEASLPIVTLSQVTLTRRIGRDGYEDLSALVMYPSD